MGSAPVLVELGLFFLLLFGGLGLLLAGLGIMHWGKRPPPEQK